MVKDFPNLPRILDFYTFWQPESYLSLEIFFRFQDNDDLFVWFFNVLVNN